MIEQDKFLSATQIKNQLLMDELAAMRSRCYSLEIALNTYIKEAHYRCLDGITECDHIGGVCYCIYHEALRKAQSLLKSSPEVCCKG